MTSLLTASFGCSSDVYHKISHDLKTTGYSINPLGIPNELAIALCEQLQNITDNQFNAAGIGRDDDFGKNDNIRNDEIYWISGNSQTGIQWLDWCNELKEHLNKHLLLGLFSFESHFAHYPPNAFYKRHVDAFQGEKNRILSIVLYLNCNWKKHDGGELVLYENKEDMNGVMVTPELGTLVVFLSEEFPHEVLPARTDRYSIAGWYRVNCSNENRVDPPN